MNQTHQIPLMDGAIFQKLIQKAKYELYQHQKSEEKKKNKELIKMVSIPSLGSKKKKDIPLLMPKNKHSHNRMILEVILLKGKDNTLFENMGPNVIVAK